jgi:hypothetical protein
MRSLIQFVCLFIVILLPFNESDAQKILVMEKAGTIKNYKYSKGDWIKLRLKPAKGYISGEINRITDSGFIMNWTQEIKLREIGNVYRRNWFCSYFGGAAITAGVGYTFIDGLNDVINAKSPVFHESVLRTSAILIAAGSILRILQFKHYTMGQGWRLKILDFSSLNQYFNNKTNGADKIH